MSPGPLDPPKPSPVELVDPPDSMVPPIALEDSLPDPIPTPPCDPPVKAPVDPGLPPELDGPEFPMEPGPCEVELPSELDPAPMDPEFSLESADPELPPLPPLPFEPGPKL